MRPTLSEPRVVVSSSVAPEQREELERLAREGDRTLSQQVRIAIREHLASGAAVRTAGVEGDHARRLGSRTP
jgi:hypothetical protein